MSKFVIAKDRKSRIQNVFRLALQRMSIAQLKKVALMLGKRPPDSPYRLEHVNKLFSVSSDDQMLSILQEMMLAGQGSLSLLRIDPAAEAEDPLELTADFKGTASSVPQIVSVGPIGEILPGLQHIQWALLDGKAAFIDEQLQLRSDDRADVVDSFFDPSVGILQVRANASVAHHIGNQWAFRLGINPDLELAPVGLADRVEVEKFAKLLGANLVKCKGQRTASKGFFQVTAKVHPDVKTMINTVDYQDWNKTTVSTDLDIEFVHDDHEAKVGFGFAFRTIVFRNIVPESTVTMVYDKVMEFLKLKRKAATP